MEHHELSADRVNTRTWTVVFLMSMSWAFSFWPVLTFQAIGDGVADNLGRPHLAVWFVPSALLPAAVVNLITGASTDLLGRRPFIVSGAFIITVGLVTLSASQTAPSIIAGMVVLGIGSALAQLCTFAVGELLPNKWRHIGAMLSECAVLVEGFCAPVLARYSLSINTWRWNLGACAIGQSIVFVGLALLYYPPAHPNGARNRLTVLKDLDYTGMALYVAGSVPVLLGLVWAGIYTSDNVHVIAPLVLGFAFLTFFAIWETYGNIKHPLTPPKIFALGKGRDATAPLLVLALLVFFFYGQSVLWPSMINVFYRPPGPYTYAWRRGAKLGLVQHGGIAAGAWLEAALGRRIRHWKWQMVIGMFLTTVFGALLALARQDNVNTAIAVFFLSNAAYGWTFVLANAVAQLGVPHRELGVLGGLANTARNAGGTISSTLYATILHTVVRQHRFTGDDRIESYRQGYKTVALASIAFGGLAVIAALCCKDVDKRMNERIEVRLRARGYDDRSDSDAEAQKGDAGKHQNKERDSEPASSKD